MKILLTNDDGIQAPGLQILGQSLCDFAELYVVAPDGERSAVSKSITFSRPLIPTEAKVDFPAALSLKLDGTPADCGKLALHKLLGFKPDFVISGVNSGPNLGVDVHYSGTVAGAFEGVHYGIPGIALSLALTSSTAPPLWSECKTTIKRVFSMLFANREKLPLSLLNINVPNRPANEIEGIKFLPLANSHYEDCYQKLTTPRSKTCYWLQGKQKCPEEISKIDLSVKESPFVTLTPLLTNQTDYTQLKNLQNDTSLTI